MRSTVITTDDATAWRERLRRLPRHDVYFRPEYHRAYERPDGRKALAYFAEHRGECFFLPLMVSPIRRVGSINIEPGRFDAETVYGYSGPLATTDDPRFLRDAWRGYGDWARQAGIVCELIRFHPLLQNHRLAAGAIETWRDRETVEMRLDRGEDELWHSYPSVQRNMLRKAVRSGLACRRLSRAEGLSSFKPIYASTMAALGAADSYHFDDGYFEALTRGLDEALTIFTVFCDALPIASAMFLLHDDTMHYHLSGSLHSHRQMAPNNLLLHEAALWGLANGYRRLHLGGGRSPRPDDPLLRFKAGLSTDRLAFYLGKRVGDPEAYEDLCACWRAQRRSEVAPGYLQMYRLDPETEGATPRPAS